MSQRESWGMQWFVKLRTGPYLGALTHIKKSNRTPKCQRRCFFLLKKGNISLSYAISLLARLVWCISSCTTSISSPSPRCETTASFVSATTTGKASTSTASHWTSTSATSRHTRDICALRNYLHRIISTGCVVSGLRCIPSERDHGRHSHSKQELGQHDLVLWTPRTRTCMTCISIHLLPGSVDHFRFLHINIFRKPEKSWWKRTP